MDGGRKAALHPSAAINGISTAQSAVMIRKGFVSVLTPVYNGAAYISRLLDSVLDQTYPDIEMIVADDGSTDSTVKIAASYIPKFKAKGYSLKIVRGPHKNASAAMNTGLCHVTGEYLVWPDSDDELCPNSIEVRVRFLADHPEYCCVRSVMEYISDDTGQAALPGEHLGDLTKEELFWDVLEGRSFVCCGCYMLKAEHFFQIYPSKRIPEYDVGQNFQMLLPFLHHHKCHTIPEKLYRVYVRLDSHSRKIRCEAEQEYRVGCFEKLADEILQICGLEENREAVDRVAIWKIRRRLQLARRYHHTRRSIQYAFMMACVRLKYDCTKLKNGIQGHVWRRAYR